MKITIQKKVFFAAPLDLVFKTVSAEDILPKVLLGSLGLPSVVRTSDVVGHWEAIGSTRRVHLADGNEVKERLIVYEPLTKFAYEVYEGTHPAFHFLVSRAEGTWHFIPQDDGVEVIWRYTFFVKHVFFIGLLWIFVHVFWSRYMDVCLNQLKRLVSSSKVI
jgi:hypothetical protein